MTSLMNSLVRIVRYGGQYKASTIAVNESAVSALQHLLLKSRGYGRKFIFVR